uniref:Uncharacterized protein n=1 Tax=uncultured marine virus TaxID=186617 RepID=A0A0F7LAU6_9VIRU|nr:hypothetical protein [uncultured marine virus]
MSHILQCILFGVQSLHLWSFLVIIPFPCTPSLTLPACLPPCHIQTQFPMRIYSPPCPFPPHCTILDVCLCEPYRFSQLHHTDSHASCGQSLICI